MEVISDDISFIVCVRRRLHINPHVLVVLDLTVLMQY
jgi:hypothetical protein